MAQDSKQPAATSTTFVPSASRLQATLLTAFGIFALGLGISWMTVTAASMVFFAAARALLPRAEAV